ncbi:hypothetical protein LX32DRAFT_186333 [Colletotrichum zoysiae]|uniref:Uncharacterized protein n=1 Tax=Colletotrichum zoysiae TaxID=1216348 RepID=A0AAD9H5U9_9PEZI|nr:hypothetical protein LX32DRAFT_186333 [Colletotrichum zoysiae]
MMLLPLIPDGGMYKDAAQRFARESELCRGWRHNVLYFFRKMTKPGRCGAALVPLSPGHECGEPPPIASHAQAGAVPRLALLGPGNGPGDNRVREATYLPTMDTFHVYPFMQSARPRIVHSRHTAHPRPTSKTAKRWRYGSNGVKRKRNRDGLA